MGSAEVLRARSRRSSRLPVPRRNSRHRSVRSDRNIPMTALYLVGAFSSIFTAYCLGRIDNIADCYYVVPYLRWFVSRYIAVRISTQSQAFLSLDRAT